MLPERRAPRPKRLDGVPARVGIREQLARCARARRTYWSTSMRSTSAAVCLACCASLCAAAAACSSMHCWICSVRSASTASDDAMLRCASASGAIHAGMAAAPVSSRGSSAAPRHAGRTGAGINSGGDAGAGAEAAAPRCGGCDGGGGRSGGASRMPLSPSTNVGAAATGTGDGESDAAISG
jgi:hypothetical protein